METGAGGLGSTLPASTEFAGTPIVTGGAAIDDDGSATLVDGGSDARGKIIVVVGTTPVAGTICSLNFGDVVPGSAVVLLQPENGEAAAALVASEIFVSHEGGGGFDIDCNNALTTGDTLWFYYYVVN